MSTQHLTRFRILLLFVAAIGSTGANAFGQEIVWGYLTENRISRADRDGTIFDDILLPAQSVATALAFESVDQQVYWAQFSSSTGTTNLRRSRLDGSQGEELGLIDDISPEIAIDSIGRKIYWTDLSFEKEIHRADLDGSNAELVISEPSFLPRIPFAIDPQAGEIYWYSSNTGLIRRANLDGSGPEDVRFILSQPERIDFDPISRFLFWTTSAGLAGPGVYRAPVDDPDPAFGDIELLIPNVGVDMELDAERGEFYVLESSLQNGSEILRASLDGSALETVVEIPASTLSLGVRIFGGGDFDGDDDRDLRDFAEFQTCFGGSGEGFCLEADLVSPVGVDLEDWTRFAAKLLGPSQ